MFCVALPFAGQVFAKNWSFAHVVDFNKLRIAADVGDDQREVVAEIRTIS